MRGADDKADDEAAGLHAGRVVLRPEVMNDLGDAPEYTQPDEGEDDNHDDLLRFGWRASFVVQQDGLLFDELYYSFVTAVATANHGSGDEGIQNRKSENQVHRPLPATVAQHVVL